MLGEVGASGPALEKALGRARAALAAEQLGGAEAVLEQTTEYAKTRIQFDRAIGSFQAVKHRLADMMVSVEAARSAAYYAACAVEELPEEADEAASIAKSWCSDAYTNCAGNMIQLLGGVGFTWEHAGAPLLQARPRQLDPARRAALAARAHRCAPAPDEAGIHTGRRGLPRRGGGLARGTAVGRTRRCAA